MKKNMLVIFLDKLTSFPLWVKQVIFLRLYQNLSAYLSEDFISVNESDIFHLYVPRLTFIGETELFERKCCLDDNIYNFLANVRDGLSMLEISMNNFWTMEEVSKYYIFCLEQDYVKTPESFLVHAMAGFMSGKFRTGEYFKRSGKINVDQLERVILKQRESIESGNPRKIAEIMIEMGLVSGKDTTSLLIIKEEAKKRFILDSSVIPQEVAVAAQGAKDHTEEIAKLTEQNKILKEQLSKIMTFMKQNG